MVRPGARVPEMHEFRIRPEQRRDPFPGVVTDLAKGDLADDPVAKVIPRRRVCRHQQTQHQQQQQRLQRSPV